MSAVKVTPNPNIKSIDPLKRLCFFDEEHPLDHPPQAYRKYSQARYIQFFLYFEKYNGHFLLGCLHIGMQDRKSTSQYDGGKQVHSLVLSSIGQRNPTVFSI